MLPVGRLPRGRVLAPGVVEAADGAVRHPGALRRCRAVLIPGVQVAVRQKAKGPEAAVAVGPVHSPTLGAGPLLGLPLWEAPRGDRRVQLPAHCGDPLPLLRPKLNTGKSQWKGDKPAQPTKYQIPCQMCSQCSPAGETPRGSSQTL